MGDVAVLVDMAFDLDDIVATGCNEGLLAEAGHINFRDGTLQEFITLVAIGYANKAGLLDAV